MPEDFFIQHFPSIKGRMLDAFLHAGWYRMGSSIFTTRSFEEHEIVHKVFWLRYRVNDVVLNRSLKSIIRKNQRFTVIIKPFENTEELERLHDLYFEKIDFMTSFSIAELMEDVNNEVYETYLIEIRNNGELVAAGIFDKGENAIAGIKNIYHPGYHQYSPGKYLMLIKLMFCQQNKIQWYYPGYIAPGHKKFDYKIFIGKSATEVYDYESSIWIPYQTFEEKKRSGS